MQVNDEAGNPLGKVKEGDTKLKVLERLSRKGGLFDKNDIGLLDSETVSTKEGPYILKISDQEPPEKKLKTDRIEITLDGLSFSQESAYVRKDYAESLQEKFRIGATPSFPEPILQAELFRSFSYFLEVNDGATEGDRRGFASIVAMPGWGKTFAMTLLAGLAAVCRRKEPANDRRALEGDIARQLENFNVNQDLVGRCVPLVITLNSSMSLVDNQGGDAAKFYTKEIAARLVYSYFADVDTITFPDWALNLKKLDDSVWTISRVLVGLQSWAERAGVDKPVMLLMIDEPDKKQGASMVLSSLHHNALLKNFEVDCRVVVSALEQHWLFAERTRSGRPIAPLKLHPPPESEVLKSLSQGLTQKYTNSNQDDIREVAKYIEVLASGHWRTISNINEAVKNSKQVTCEALKLFAGRAPPHIPPLWTNEKKAMMEQLEEALAHAVVGSKLRWMEPIHKGTVWQAITNGVILKYIGLQVHETVDAVVPLLTVLRLSEVLPYDERELEFGELHDFWSQHVQSGVRNALLVKVMGISRFFPSRDVSSNAKKHELFENLAGNFMLLRWDAHARIDRVAKRRWALPAADLMTVPNGLDEETSKLDSFDKTRVEKLRNATNVAWVNSLEAETTKAPDVPPEPPTARPNLWLVPPKFTEGKGEEVLRLCIFRKANCCTESRGSVKVFPPEPEKSKYYTCHNKLLTRNAKITPEATGALPSGSVIEPAHGNEGFDSLTLLSKVGGGSAFVLIENKFEANAVGEDKVKAKLNELKKYRGVLWQCRGGKAPKESDLLKRLGLPLVQESDVVWVLLADVGYTTVLPGQVRLLLESTDAFQGHVLLTTSSKFFGPCFGKVGILDANKKEKLNKKEKPNKKDEP